MSGAPVALRRSAAPKTSRRFVVPTKMRSGAASAYSLAADAVSVESTGAAAMITYSYHGAIAQRGWTGFRRQ
jgi:hypothetical protein